MNNHTFHGHSHEEKNSESGTYEIQGNEVQQIFIAIFIGTGIIFSVIIFAIWQMQSNI